jgi:hypothetical protein
MAAPHRQSPLSHIGPTRQSPALFPNLTAALGACELPPLPAQRATNPASTRIAMSLLP